MVLMYGILTKQNDGVRDKVEHVGDCRKCSLTLEFRPVPELQNLLRDLIFNSIMLFGSESFGHNSRSDLWVTIRADPGKLWLNK